MTSNIKSWLLGIGFGIAYGLCLRLLSGSYQLQNILVVMSIGFMVFGPLIIGWVTVHFSKDPNLTKLKSFFMPFLSIFFGCLVTYLMKIEGLICIIMYLPLGFLLSGFGGLIAYSKKNKPSNKASMLIMLALPFAAQFTENKINFETRSHTVKNSIHISSSAPKVWNEIKSVKTITKNELDNSWVHSMGFPRPLDAEIDHEGIGGIRTARFERGLVFNETVNQWQPNKLLSFKIEVDPKDIPPTALDEHVTIGGPFFDVLHGTYEIAEQTDGSVILNLESKFRLSTHFNSYAGMWTNLIMHQIQSDILSVIKKRSETL